MDRERLGQGARSRRPAAVTLSSTSGRFQATITNDLDQPVTVALDAAVRRPAHIDGPRRIEVRPNGRVAVLLTARTDENGIHEVTLLVTDKRGTPLGATHRPHHPLGPGQQRDLAVRRPPARALLFGAIGVRLFRRVRNARRAPDGRRRTPRTGDAAAEPTDAKEPAGAASR